MRSPLVPDFVLLVLFCAAFAAFATFVACGAVSHPTTHTTDHASTFASCTAAEITEIENDPYAPTRAADTTIYGYRCQLPNHPIYNRFIDPDQGSNRATMPNDVHAPWSQVNPTADTCGALRLQVSNGTLAPAAVYDHDAPCEIAYRDTQDLG